MRKDIELSIAALALLLCALDPGADALMALAEGRWLSVAWNAGAALGLGFLAKAVWDAA